MSIFDLIFDVFWVEFWHYFYMGYAWNVYEVGMAYALFLHELCQEVVGEAVGLLKETQQKT